MSEALRVAGIIGGRAAFFGIAMWIAVPPVGLAAIVTGSLCVLVPMLLCWRYRGPALGSGWIAAASFALANVAVALLFARILLITVGLPGR